MPIKLTKKKIGKTKNKNKIIFPSRIIWRLAAFVNNNNCIHCSIFENEFKFTQFQIKCQHKSAFSANQLDLIKQSKVLFMGRTEGRKEKS